MTAERATFAFAKDGVTATMSSFIELSVIVPDEFDPRSYVQGVLSTPTQRSWPPPGVRNASEVFAVVVRHGESVWKFATWPEVYEWLRS